MNHAITEAKSTPTEPNKRKRRLSKKEKKNLKKQKKWNQTKHNHNVENNDIKTNDLPEEENSFDYLKDYKPIPMHLRLPTTQKQINEEALGKWFPTAKIVKSSSTKNNDQKQTCSILLFYQYATPQWSKEKVQHLISYLITIGKERNLGGRIRVATEGVNATISCTGHTNNHGCIDLRYFAQDLKQVDAEVFDKTDFKYIDQLPLDRHFKDLKILPVQELVFYGIREKDAPLSNGGVHLPPKEYHEKLGKKDCIVIDVRNHYEAAIGRFDGQMQGNNDNLNTKKETSNISNNDEERNNGIGAEYIDPMMRKSTDFTTWLDKKETQEKIKGKEVLMYCTGGVRCERASAYLKTKLGDKLQLKGVYQLQGGIEKYLKAFPDGGYWQGKNFVFDKREAISAHNPNGDGGVVRKTQKKKQKHLNEKNNHDSNELQSGPICCCCGDPWDRYIGKKKCFTCGVPVLMCDKCMSKKPDKNAETLLSVRCPLCKKEGITVPASEVDYTENGKKSKEKEISNVENQNHTNMKAATSVLKWGGGHAHEKKELRKLKRKKCRFGKDCVRKDCFFAH